MERDVASHIVLNVSESADLTFSVAVSGQYTAIERFTATIDGAPVQFSELHDAHGTRLHRIMSPVGQLVVDYSAKITGQGDLDTATEVDTLIFQRPSRYAQSDELAPTAGAEFAGISDHHELLTAVSSWVGTHLSYVPGSSLPTDGATRTLLARQGVCRDYAHLCVALLRASGIPARLVAVYAPGLVPMDFHAVAEAWIDGVWRVVDATTLAPRATLVRIATGRDAADTAWLTVNSGRADVLEITVSATVDSLPGDDLDQLVSIA